MMHPRWMLGPKWHRNLADENRLAQRVAKRIAQAVHFPPVQPTRYVEVNPAVATQIAHYYDRASSAPRNPDVRRAYNGLVRAVSMQFSVLKRLVKIEPYGDGMVPYRDSSEMMEDLKKRRHLWVYTGGEDHPVMSRRVNWMFRAVHDFFGHAAQGYGFGPRGEENAWIEHSKLFDPVGRAALTTETRGQNSWVNFGPYKDLPPAKRPYAKQKAIILPIPFLVHPEFARAYRRWPWFV